MKEWNNPYNPFNSFKVLLWRDHLEGLAKENYLIPVGVDVDPSNKCNYNCAFCNGYNVITESNQLMSEEHLLKLANFLKEWGKNTKEGHPKSVCIGGGGEPLMNPATPVFIEKLFKNGIEVGLITNGSLINNKNITTLVKNSRWIGVSVDAGTSKTYQKIKGIKEDLFYIVCENISKLVKKSKELGVKNNVTFKFLLSPTNAEEIYKAAKLAKLLGVVNFQLRPVGYLNITKTEGKKLLYSSKLLREIDKQIEKALELEDENFHVYGIRHKFKSDFQPKKNFSRCWAIPILPTFNADGNVYMCFDMRGRKNTIMCKHIPDVTEIARFWNSEEHKKMVREYDINTCPRCTLTAYNEIIEKAILEDGFCKTFI